MGKLLIIGVDGADWDYVSRRMASGGLPHMAAMARDGAFGPLESTCPPLSCPAWPTMTTGVSPGNLGLFDLTVPMGYGKRIVAGSDVGAPRMWDYVGACGGRAVVLNVPVTFPPRELNGVMVAGFLSPEGLPYTWPGHVGEELASAFGYSTRPEHSKRRQVWKLHQRKEVLLYLLAHNEWDFAMVVLSVTDWAQHDHWNDRGHIDRLFDEADAAVGEIADATAAGNVAVVSDHGFCGARRILNVNRLLCDLGFLTYGEGSALNPYAPNRALTESGRAQGPAGRVLTRVIKPRQALRLLHRCGMERALDLIPGRLWQWLKRNVGVWDAPIDWRRTRAYLYNGLPQTLNANLLGREPEGTVSPDDYDATCGELARALVEAVDPTDGTPIVSNVRRRAEAFPGCFVGAAPDLVLDLTDDRYLVSPADHPEVVWQTGRERGRHRSTGMYLLRGPAFRPYDHGPRADIVNMMPTLLAAAGCPVPEGIDGRTIGGLLAQADRVGTKDYDLSVPETARVEDDMAEVRRSLEKLGYM